MPDWYEKLPCMWWNRGWTLSYALFSGHFVDDFGNLVRHHDDLLDHVHLY